MQLKILLVDDDIVSLKKLRILLSPYGECHMVMEGEKALEIFQKAHSQDSPYSLITLDVDMPKLSGFKVLKQIRSWEGERGVRPVRVLMTTGHDDRESIDSAVALGCTYYLLKPFDAVKVEDAMIKVWKTQAIPSQSPAPVPSVPETPFLTFRRILIADDEIVSLSKLKVLLAKMGPCETAKNGREALEKFIKAHEEQTPFELITLDIEMPELKGPEVLKEIRKWEAQQGFSSLSQAVNVLMVTASGARETVIESIRAGCTNYIVKPFDGKKLEEALSKLRKALPV